jgi:hypothetical protein
LGKLSILEQTKSFTKGIGDLGEKAFVPISTVAGNISKDFKQQIRKFVYSLNKSEAESKNEIKNYIEETQKMSEEDFLRLDLALKNKDTVTAEMMIKQYQLENSFSKVQNLLKDIYEKAVKAGIDIGHLDDYFPRKIKYYNEFMEYTRKTDKWTAIEEALSKIDPTNEFTNEEKADAINKLLMGRQVNGITLFKPDNIKTREIESVDENIFPFYATGTEALIDYVSTMEKAIEVAKFLGKGEELDISIGWFVNEQIKNGSITSENEQKVKDLLTALINQKGTYGVVNALKN